MISIELYCSKFTNTIGLRKQNTANNVHSHSAKHQNNSGNLPICTHNN